MAVPEKPQPREVLFPAGMKILGMWKTTELMGGAVEILTRPMRPNETPETYTVLVADLGLNPEFTPKLVLREQAARKTDIPPQSAAESALTHGKIPFDATVDVVADDIHDSFLISGTEEDNL